MTDQENPESLNESSPPTQGNKTKSKRRYVINGLILCGLFFILWNMIAPLFVMHCCRIPEQYVRSELHNIYLSCRAYWADSGSDSVCPRDIAQQTAYGYVRSKDVEIALLGNESNFMAYAVHTKDAEVYKLTLRDHQNRQSYDIQLITGPFSQKKLNEIGLHISSAKRDLGHLIHACSAYWDKNGNDKNCTPEVATKTTYRYHQAYGEHIFGRYIQSPDVVITAQGNELNFIAQAESKEDGRMFRWKSSDFTVDKIKEVFPWSWVFFWE